MIIICPVANPEIIFNCLMCSRILIYFPSYFFLYACTDRYVNLFAKSNLFIYAKLKWFFTLISIIIWIYSEDKTKNISSPHFLSFICLEGNQISFNCMLSNKYLTFEFEWLRMVFFLTILICSCVLCLSIFRSLIKWISRRRLLRRSHI